MDLWLLSQSSCWTTSTQRVQTQRKKKFNCEEKSKETATLNRIKNKRTSLLAEKSKRILASPRANLAHNKAITLNTNGKVVVFYKIPIKTPDPLPTKPNSQGIKVSTTTCFTTKPELKVMKNWRPQNAHQYFHVLYDSLAKNNLGSNSDKVLSKTMFLCQYSRTSEIMCLLGHQPQDHDCHVWILREI